MRVRRRVKQLVSQDRRTWVSLGAMVLLLTVGGLAAPAAAKGLGLSGMSLLVATLLVNLIVVGGTLTTVFVGLHRIRIRAYRQAVFERGHPVCVGCGYVFQGHDGPTVRCPECGGVSARPGSEERRDGGGGGSPTE